MTPLDPLRARLARIVANPAARALNPDFPAIAAELVAVFEYVEGLERRLELIEAAIAIERAP